MNQFLALSITGTIAIVSFAIAYKALLVGLGIVVLMFILIFIAVKIFSFDSKTAAGRVRELETEINKLAGATLLVWENKYGPNSIGLLKRMFPKARSTSN